MKTKTLLMLHAVVLIVGGFVIHGIKAESPGAIPFAPNREILDGHDSPILKVCDSPDDESWVDVRHVVSICKTPRVRQKGDQYHDLDTGELKAYQEKTTRWQVVFVGVDSTILFASEEEADAIIAKTLKLMERHK